MLLADPRPRLFIDPRFEFYGEGFQSETAAAPDRSAACPGQPAE